MMLSAKEYVPNPEKWIKFFKNEAERKLEPKSWGKTIISIEDHKPKAMSTSLLKIEAVTPTQRTVEQAKSELLRKHTSILRNSHSSKRRKMKSAVTESPKQTSGGSKIYNKPRQTRAKKVVPTWDSSGF